MFGIFKKKTVLEKLEIQYQKLIEETYKLSTIDRTASDKKFVEANKILQQIEKHSN